MATAVTAIGRPTVAIFLVEGLAIVLSPEESTWPDEDRQSGGAQEDHGRDVLADGVRAHRLDEPEQDAGEECSSNAAEATHHGHDGREDRQVEARVHRHRPGHRARDRYETGEP